MTRTVTDHSGKSEQYSTGLVVSSSGSSGASSTSILFIILGIPAGSLVTVLLARYHRHNKRLATHVNRTRSR